MTSIDERECEALKQLTNELYHSLHQLWETKNNIGNALHTLDTLQNKHHYNNNNDITTHKLQYQYNTLDNCLKTANKATQIIIQRIHKQLSQIEN